MGALLLVALAGAPAQGLSVRVTALELRGASVDDAALVTRALGAELALEGYEVRAEGKTAALIVGRLEKGERGFVLKVSLVDAAKEIELDDVRLSLSTREELAGAGTEAAKRLASAIRTNWGVRARLKL